MNWRSDNLPENPAEGRSIGTNVNDTSKIGERLARRREQVVEAHIPETDREAILKFFKHRRADGMSRNTLVTDLSTLRCASERAETPLTEMSKLDVDDFLVELVTPRSEGGYGLERDGGGIFNYKRTFRVFFRWLHSRGEYGEFDFWDSIDLPKQEPKSIPKENRLEPDDIAVLKKAAGQGRNPDRDRALIAFLAEGHRITAAAQLRVKDVDVYSDDPVFRLNDSSEDGYKSMEKVERPLLWCTAVLRVWLSEGHHPEPNNPEAPLWTVNQYDPENPQESALGNDGISSMLERVADRASVDKPVNPHNFRHAAHTRLRNEPEISERDQEHLGGWIDDRRRMLDRYDETTIEEKNRNLRTGLGLSISTDDDEATTPRPHPCYYCNIELAGDETFCPSCGMPQNASTRLARRQAKQDVQDGIGDEADDARRTAARAALLEALDDPIVIERVEAAMDGD